MSTEKLKVNVVGNGRTNFKISPLTLKDVINWIENQSYDDYTKTKLIAIASSYPNQALSGFKRNIMRHIALIRKEQNKNKDLK
jgi:hypothetical protein